MPTKQVSSILGLFHNFWLNVRIPTTLRTTKSFLEPRHWHMTRLKTQSNDTWPPERWCGGLRPVRHVSERCDGLQDDVWREERDSSSFFSVVVAASLAVTASSFHPGMMFLSLICADFLSTTFHVTTWNWTYACEELSWHLSWVLTMSTRLPRLPSGAPGSTLLWAAHNPYKCSMRIF